MDNNLINSFVDIFTKYYKFYNDHKLSYYRSLKNNKLYDIVHKYNNNYLISLYSIYFNNPRYYDQNNITMFKEDLKESVIKSYDNIDYEDFKLLNNEIIKMYEEETNDLT
jgi:hypothetical protein